MLFKGVFLGSQVETVFSEQNQEAFSFYCMH